MHPIRKVFDNQRCLLHSHLPIKTQKARKASFLIISTIGMKLCMCIEEMELSLSIILFMK